MQDGTLMLPFLKLTTDVLGEILWERHWFEGGNAFGFSRSRDFCLHDHIFFFRLSCNARNFSRFCRLRCFEAVVINSRARPIVHVRQKLSTPSSEEKSRFLLLPYAFSPAIEYYRTASTFSASAFFRSAALSKHAILQDFNSPLLSSLSCIRSSALLPDHE